MRSGRALAAAGGLGVACCALGPAVVGVVGGSLAALVGGLAGAAVVAVAAALVIALVRRRRACPSPRPGGTQTDAHR